jgi:hypothetical protein
MESNVKLNAQKDVNKNIKEILNFYGEFHLSRLLNDLVAIGTWPTPEDSLESKGKTYDLKGKLGIDTVPLPELKKILTRLMQIYGDKPLKEFLG